MSLPSGRQVVLHHQDQVAVVVEVGGGLRSYGAGGREVLDGYGPDELCPSGRGQALIPWPNRLARGHYRFAGVDAQAALDEPAAGNAIHGLTRWRTWDVATEAGGGGPGRAVMSHRLRPSPGYPFDLELAITYTLGDSGLTVATTARNVGNRPCPYAVGFHPYLSAGGGLVDDLALRAPGQVRYLVDDYGIPTGTEAVAGAEWDFCPGRRIGAVRLDTGYTDLQRGPDGRATVILGDPVTGRGATVWMDAAFTHLMLFSGDTVADIDRRRRGLAVEPMTAAPDAYNSGDGLRVLEVGETAEATWGITPS